jgi:hypothetical protein
MSRPLFFPLLTYMFWESKFVYCIVSSMSESELTVYIEFPSLTLPPPRSPLQKGKQAGWIIHPDLDVGEVPESGDYPYRGGITLPFPSCTGLPAQRPNSETETYVFNKADMQVFSLWILTLLFLSLQQITYVIKAWGWPGLFMRSSFCIDRKSKAAKRVGAWGRGALKKWWF